MTAPDLIRTRIETTSAMSREGHAAAHQYDPVRAHLSTLERDGMVRSAGVRRGLGAGKPSTVYELPPQAEMVFSRAYPPVLGALLEEVVSRLPREQMEAILVGTGRRLAEPLLPPGTASRAARLRAAVEVLNALGGGSVAGGGGRWGHHPRLRMSARLGRGATARGLPSLRGARERGGRRTGAAVLPSGRPTELLLRDRRSRLRRAARDQPRNRRYAFGGRRFPEALRRAAPRALSTHGCTAARSSRTSAGSS